MFELRKEVAKKLLVENNIRAKLEEIIITPGSKMALSLVLMSIIKPNDELIYFSPAYTSYVPQMLLSENKIIIKKLTLNNLNFEIDFNKLEKIITNKINDVVEKMVLRNPGQWIWTHSRWK